MRQRVQRRDHGLGSAVRPQRQIAQAGARRHDRGYQSATNILKNNGPILEKIAATLLEREVIDAGEIEMIIEGKELPVRVNPNVQPPKEDVQQVLKPASGQQPNVAPERPAQA